MRKAGVGGALVLAGAVLLAVAAAGATTPSVFPTGITALYAASTGSDVVASVTPGTALDLADPPGKAAREQVTLEGWSPKGAGALVYKAPDLRILLARLAHKSARKVLGEQKDPFGTTWRHVSLSAWVDTNAVTDSAANVWASAQKLYSARCSACHALHNPKEFTANQWPGILTTMAKNAALDPAQKALVTQYLQNHARP